MIQIETQALKNALDELALVVPKKATVPVLENLRWQVMDGEVNLVASDLDNSLEVLIPVKASDKGEAPLDVLLPALTLRQALRRESSPNVLTSLRDGKFELHADGRLVIIPCRKPDNFPTLPQVDDTPAGLFLAAGLAGALAKTLFCVAKEESRYSLTALKLELHNSLFRLVATDGHRLSLVEGAAKPGATTELHTLIPASTARLLLRLLASRPNGWVEVATGDHALGFYLPDGSALFGRAATGPFPTYEKVLPKAPVEATITFDRAELADALAKAGPLVKKATNHPIKFNFSKVHPIIEAESEGSTTALDLAHARVSGKARTIGFDHMYLSDYVTSVDTETVTMNLFTPSVSEVALFHTFRYQHLLMPLRV
jgi:DNA polymerase-3 subunit beta